MSKVTDITTLAGEFKELSELKAYTDHQFITIQKLQTENKSLKSEVEHLKKVLNGVVPNQPLVEEIIVSQEELLIEKQIFLLKERAMDKELTLEETKRLDLLIKNLHLTRGKSNTINAQSKNLSEDITDAKLIEMAVIQNEIKE